MKLGSSGQSLLEFAICLPVVTIAVSVAVLLLGTEWNRIQCAEKAFHAAHRALRASEKSAKLSQARAWWSGVRVEQTDVGVVAHARCGRAVEDVALPTLENAQW